MKAYDKGWLLGFFEGEGYFKIGINISRGKWKENRWFRATPCFGINQKDKEAIAWIHDYLTQLGIKSYMKRTRHSTHHGKPYTMWIVETCNVNNCLKLRKLLRSCTWRTLKVGDFEIWSQILDLLASRPRKPWCRDEVLELVSLYEKLNERAGKKKKYTRNFFHKLFKEQLGWDRKARYKSKGIFWTEDKVEKLKELYPTTPTKEIVEIFDRTPRAIRVKASRLGLMKSK